MEVSRKDLAKMKFKELLDYWSRMKGAEFTERDTIFHFILPMLEILGWDVHDIAEVKQGGYPRSFQKSLPASERAIDFPDCVVSISGNPYINLEFKKLTQGTIDYEHTVENLLRKAEYLKTRYAVLTRFKETMIYDPKSEISNIPTVRFTSPKDCFDRFNKLWIYMSREEAENWIKLERLRF